MPTTPAVNGSANGSCERDRCEGGGREGGGCGRMAGARGGGGDAGPVTARARACDGTREGGGRRAGAMRGPVTACAERPGRPTPARRQPLAQGVEGTSEGVRMAHARRPKWHKIADIDPRAHVAARFPCIHSRNAGIRSLQHPTVGQYRRFCAITKARRAPQLRSTERQKRRCLTWPG